MKIAICLYGKFTGKNERNEIQGFEIPFSFLKKNVINQNCDLFFHGWDDDENESKKLISMTSPKSFILEKQKEFNHPYKHYNFVPSGPWNTKKYLDNNYSRFYSLKRSFELIDESYDIVLISRFDTVFFEKFDLTSLNPENFYVSHWNLNHQGWGFNDGWFASGYENIKKISLIYDRLDDYFDLNSDYMKYLKSYDMDETNITSCHAIWRFRADEIKLRDRTFALGNEYDTWGLLRRMHERINPWGKPNVDLSTPVRI
jgi:hypothetical protein